MQTSKNTKKTVPISLTDPGLICSSATLAWEGITVEERRDKGSEEEYHIPPLPYQMVCLYLGKPIWLQQKRGGKTHLDYVSRGNSQLVPLHQASSWQHHQQAYHLHLLLKPDFLARIASETAEFDTARIELVNQFSVKDTQIETLGLALLTELKQHGITGRLYSEALITALATYLLKHYNAFHLEPSQAIPRLSSTRLQNVLDYLQANLSRDISLKELAQLANLSQSHFSNLFRQSTGLSPYQYLTLQRVEQAKNLLLQTELEVAQIAVKVGFYDQSHLARHFRRLYKISPQQFRLES